MTSLACDAEIAIFRMSRGTAAEVSSSCVLVWYVVGLVREGQGAAVKRDPAELCCTVSVRSKSCWWRRVGLDSPHI